MKLEPEFDPVAGEWFLPDGRAARSLAELAVVVGGARRLAGYYPKGYVVRTRETARGWSSRMRLGGLMPRFVASAPVAEGERKPRRLVLTGERKRQRDEAVLNDWAAGLLAREIAARHSFARWQTVHNLIHHYRKAGEPRAAARGKGWAGSLPKEES